MTDEKQPHADMPPKLAGVPVAWWKWIVLKFVILGLGVYVALHAYGLL